MSASPTVPAVTSFPLSATPRIVAALTAREWRLFIADASEPPVDTSGWRILRDDELDPAGWAARLEELRPEILVTGWRTSPLPEAWLSRADCPLRYVCHVTGSVRRLVPRAFIERGGLVTNWGDSVSNQVAEHALLLVLAALRNAAGWRPFIARDPSVRRIEELGTKTLFGRQVGLHGFGSVARALLPLLAPFGVTVRAFSAGVSTDMMRAAGVEPCDSLASLFAQSEVLVECEALTPATERSVSAALLAALPDGAIFVNIGRGGLVDDEALLREAASGRLRIALDVANGEPLTPASPYVQSGGIVLSPHIGGPTLDRYRNCGELALANLRSVLHGRTPPSLVDLATYDRAT